VLQRREEKSPETAAFFSKRIEVAPFDQRSEETLGKISRIVGCRAATPDIRIKGIPVDLTQLRQCGSSGRIAVSSRIHDAPTCGLESQIERPSRFRSFRIENPRDGRNVGRQRMMVTGNLPFAATSVPLTSEDGDTTMARFATSMSRTSNLARPHESGSQQYLASMWEDVSRAERYTSGSQGLQVGSVDFDQPLRDR
jgi:hypothetical protein